MRHSGIREARQNLSELLRFVAHGHEIVITDRGRAVARLVPPLPLSPRAFLGRRSFRRGMPRFSPPVSAALAERPGAAAAVATRGLAGPVYLDGTALAKLYLPEPGSDLVEAGLAGRRDLTVSDLAATELIAAFSLRREQDPNRVPALAAGRLHAALLEDLEGGCFRRVELSPPVHRAAERLALSLGGARALRTRQVLHLALAMTAGVASVLTFDADLALVAAQVGLHPAPELPESIPPSSRRRRARPRTGKESR